MKKQILINLASNYLLSFFGMALGFMLVPFLIHKIGRDAYGVTMLAESTVAFFEVLTISVRMALSRHATFALSRDELESFVEYLSTGRVILYFSATIVLVAGALVSVNFTHLFQVPAALGLDSKVLFFLICFAFTVSIPNIIFWSVLYAKQRFDLINFSSSFGLVMRAVCLFLYYSFAPKAWQTLTAYGLIYLIMTLTQNYMIYYWHRKMMPQGLHIRFKHFKKERVREILSFSLHTSLTKASALLYQETAQIIINIFWGPGLNAIYAVAQKFPNMMRRVFIEPSYALTPTFTDLAARGKHDRIGQLLYTYSKALSILTLPVCFLLIFFAKPLIYSWVGPEFEMAGRLLPYFSVSLFVSIPFSLTGCILNAYGKVKIPSFVSIASALCNVTLCLVLGQWCDYKLFGVAIAALVSSVLVGTIFLPVYSCRISGLSVRRYWIESFVKPFFLSSVFMIGGFYGLGLSRFSVFLDAQLLLTLTGLITAFYLSSYVLLLNADEKRYIHETVRLTLAALNRMVLKTPSDTETL